MSDQLSVVSKKMAADRLNAYFFFEESIMATFRTNGLMGLRD